MVLIMRIKITIAMLSVYEMSTFGRDIHPNNFEMMPSFQTLSKASTIYSIMASTRFFTFKFCVKKSKTRSRLYCVECLPLK